ncbi:hypothetical protein [Actinomadura sp. 3N508]|uniref:hypothetical protein n=1 Tax=Actinomadura sp. 3N508 TaxID=3375153 RepID=UPI00379308F9
MDLRLIGIDPDSGDGHCPAVFVDRDSRDLVLVAKTVGGAADLAQVLEHTPIGDDEMLVRMPSRMRATILSALLGEDLRDDDGVAAAG